METPIYSPSTDTKSISLQAKHNKATQQKAICKATKKHLGKESSQLEPENTPAGKGNSSSKTIIVRFKLFIYGGVSPNL